jgi:hypothetical protein
VRIMAERHPNQVPSFEHWLAARSESSSLAKKGPAKP